VWKYTKPQLLGLVLIDDRPSENGSQIFIRPRGQIGFYNDAIGDSLALEMVKVATNCAK
jgi:hypothetical protein